MEFCAAVSHTLECCGQFESMPRQTKHHESRREFLKSCGALIVSFSAGSLSSFGCRAEELKVPVRNPSSHIDPEKLDSWLAVAADGDVTATDGKMRLSGKESIRLKPSLSPKNCAFRLPGSSLSSAIQPFVRIREHVWKSIDSNQLQRRRISPLPQPPPARRCCVLAAESRANRLTSLPWRASSRSGRERTQL